MRRALRPGLSRFRRGAIATCRHGSSRQSRSMRCGAQQFRYAHVFNDLPVARQGRIIAPAARRRRTGAWRATSTNAGAIFNLFCPAGPHPDAVQIHLFAWMGRGFVPPVPRLFQGSTHVSLLICGGCPAETSVNDIQLPISVDDDQRPRMAGALSDVHRPELAGVERRCVLPRRGGAGARTRQQTPDLDRPGVDLDRQADVLTGADESADVSAFLSPAPTGSSARTSSSTWSPQCGRVRALAQYNSFNDWGWLEGLPLPCRRRRGHRRHSGCALLPRAAEGHRRRVSSRGADPDPVFLSRAG